MNQHHFTDINITKHLEASEVEIHASLPADRFAHYRDQALSHLGSTLAIDGFRKGHIPPHVIATRVGEESIVREMVDLVLSKELPLLLLSEGILPLNTPAVTINALGMGETLKITVRVEIMPEFELPDYAAIAKTHPAPESHPEVTEEEFTEALQHIAREQARIKKVESGIEPAQAAEESSAITPNELPEVEEDFATSLGYASLQEFKDKLRHNLSHEKARREHEKQRTALLEEMVKKTSVHLPTSLVSHELDKMEAQLTEDLDRAHISFDQYLEHLKKSRDDIREEWTPSAVKRATIQLILAKIAQKEHINAPEREVNELTQHTLTSNPGLSKDNVQAYYTQQLRNEAVLRFLEGSTGPETHHDHGDHHE